MIERPAFTTTRSACSVVRAAANSSTVPPCAPIPGTRMGAFGANRAAQANAAASLRADHQAGPPAVQPRREVTKHFCIYRFPVNQ